jgi:hypothetical protein
MEGRWQWGDGDGDGDGAKARKGEWVNEVEKRVKGAIRVIIRLKTILFF